MIHTAGNGMQGHVQYGINSGLWWRWQFTGTQTLQSYSSSDGLTWTARNALGLAFPHNGEGQNLAVAYKNIAGVDVVHIVLSYAANGQGFLGNVGYLVNHVRATLTNAPACTFAAEDRVNGPNGDSARAGDGILQVDGPGIAIDSANSIWIASGFLNGPLLFQIAATSSLHPDAGSSWTGGWNSPYQGGGSGSPESSCWYVLPVSTGRYLLRNDSTGTDRYHAVNIRFEFWPTGAGGPTTGNWLGAFTKPAQLASNTGSISPELAYSWAVVPVTNTTAHAVRKNGMGIDHFTISGGSASPGDAIPPLPAGPVDVPGLSLTTDGTSVWLMAQDAQTLRLMSCRWRGAYPHTTWDAWIPLTS